MISPSPDLIARVEALKAFVRAVNPGGCRILSDPDCQCRLCTIDAALALLLAAPAPPAPTEASTVYVACYGIGWPEDGDAVLGAFPSEAAAKAALDAAGVHGWVTACVICTSSAVITNG